MATMQMFLFVLQVLVAVSLILLILVQHGKGAEAGAAFGSGASATVFGAQGSGGFLTRMTTALAAVFLANSLALAYIANARVKEPQTLTLDAPPAAVAPAAVPELPAIPAEPSLPAEPAIPAAPAANRETPLIPEER